MQQPHSADHKPIPGPKGKPLVGNLPDIPFERFHLYLKEQSRQYGDIFKLKLVGKNMVVLSNPDTVRAILKRRPNDFRRISNMQTVFDELGVNGVFSAEGEEWKLQRKMMNLAFSANQLGHYLPIIEATSERLGQTLAALSESQQSESTQSTDFQALMQRYTIDITTQLAFGADVNSLGNSNSPLQDALAVVFPMISKRVKAPFPYWRYFKLKQDKQLDQAMVYIHSQCERFIKEAEAAVKSGNAPANILQAMIKARDEEGIPFTQAQLFANIITLLLAGEDTTANTLAWIMHYLTQQPHYQEQLFAEINSLSEALDLSNLKQLDQLPLLNAVIQESMRMMPVAPFLYLENIGDETIEGYRIPAGTMLVALLSQSGHDNNRYPQADTFRPERWLAMDEAEQREAGKGLMHFGGGARLCPGMQLSFIEIKYALITLLRDYRFSAAADNNCQSLFAFTVIPQGLNITVSKRAEP